MQIAPYLKTVQKQKEEESGVVRGLSLGRSLLATKSDEETFCDLCFLGLSLGPRRHELQLWKSSCQTDR
jgi:hypothetical protein